MSEQPHNPPAFPARNYIVPAHLDAKHVAALGDTQGMSLRDYFAGQALIGMFTPTSSAEAADIANNYAPTVIATYAKAAYVVADAMLAAREKGATDHGR